MPKRIGVFVCHCGINIAGTVDVKRVAEEVSKDPRVAFATDYVYMCSDPGQNLVREAIKEHNLDGVIIAACSPTLHETTFRRLVQGVGLNPYLCEIANIREQCSWVHEDKEEATRKAIKIVKAVIERLSLDQPLEPIEFPLIKKALVIGGGIAGIQAALDIADAGYQVYLVERQPSIGGHMAQLSETFPTLDCSQCILTPKMVEVARHPNITLMTYSEVEEISGYVGNFKVKVRRKATYVDWDKCTGCGLCMERCPVKVPSEFDRGLGERKAIYIPFPQAVPNRPVIDAEHCLYLTKGRCRTCERVCPTGAINYEMEDRIEEIEVGAIVVATGYELFPKEKVGEYGYGKYPDVIDGLQFERMLSASGPTGGKIRRPSDGKEPKEVVFIQCVGSRDDQKGIFYCSKICCMYTAKHALLYKHRVHDGQPYVFYMDIRAGGKGYEEFVRRAQEEEGVIYIRGRVSRVYEENGKLIVEGADTLSGQQVRLAVDMVVLATAMVPSPGVQELAAKLKIPTDQYGFLTEAHPKLRPVESVTSGIFLAGCAQGPKDIPETVAQASGAASKVLALFSKDKLYHEPVIAEVDEDRCSGCGICVPVCPYGAREIDPEKKVAKVTEVLCEGCGACTAACPAGAAQLRNLTDQQITKMVEAVLSE